MSDDPAPTRPPLLVLGLLAASLLVGILAIGAAGRAREAAAKAIQQAEAAAKAAEAARKSAEKARQEAADIWGDLDLLSTSVGALEKNLKTLADSTAKPAG